MLTIPERGLHMPKGHRRDIYKGRFDPGFCLDKDVDLEHLRELMTRDEITNEEYNYYGLYSTPSRSA